MKDTKLTESEIEALFTKWRDVLSWDSVKGDSKINKAIILESQEKIHFIKEKEKK